MTKEEIRELKFIRSALALKIPNIGEAAAKEIYDYIVENSQPDDFLDLPGREIPYNILECTAEDINYALGGKLGTNAAKAFTEYKKHLTLKDIIISCTFESCGNKVAEMIEKQILTGDADFTHLAEKSWNWCLDPLSQEMTYLYNIINKSGKSIGIFKQEFVNEQVNEGNRIPVILTGEPNTYPTKTAFLNAHPEYKLTSSWKEVQIVFTNSLESNTGKMKKVKEKNIEIKLY
jgi:hypothetical protein